MRRTMRRGVLAAVTGLIALGATLVLAGCAVGKPDLVPSDDGVKAAVTVRVVDNTYEPAEVQITPDQAVRWVFEGQTEHDVVADDGSFVSDLMTDGEYTHHFAEEGVYEYDCSIHPEMRGVVRVVAP